MVKPEQKMIVSLHNAIPLFARGQKYSSNLSLISSFLSAARSNFSTTTIKLEKDKEKKDDNSEKKSDENNEKERSKEEEEEEKKKEAIAQEIAAKSENISFRNL